MRPELERWDDAPAAYEVVFSTRRGGVSEGPYASLNIGLLTDDARGRIEANRRRLAAAAAVDAERLTWPRQVHGIDVLAANGRGAPGDGMWTDERGRALLVVVADCLPVALVRLDGRPRVALLHAGWRGLVAGVVEAGRAALGAGAVAAVVGPGIGPCCYEVGANVAGPMEDRFGAGLVHEGRLDLKAAAERALRSAGVARVDRVGGCTACAPERYFSHRRDRGVTGRQGAVAVIR